MLFDISSLFLRLACATVLVLTVLYRIVVEGWSALWLDEETWTLVVHLQGAGWGDLALPGALAATVCASIAVIFWVLGMLCRTVSFLFAAVVGASLLFGGMAGAQTTIAWLFLILAMALAIQGGGAIGIDGLLRARRGKRGRRGGGAYRMIGA